MAIFRRQSLSPRPRLLLGLLLLLATAYLILYAPSRNHIPYLRGTKPATPIFIPSAFNWATVKPTHAEFAPRPLPRGRPSTQRRVQHAFPPYREDATTRTRRLAVRSAFLWAWSAYRAQAWLRDGVGPLSGAPGEEAAHAGWAGPLVQGLDTLWIMDLRGEFYEAAAAAAALDWNRTAAGGGRVAVRESTGRILGGLLGAYDMSGERALLRKARELGDLLYMAFDTPNGLPGVWLDFRDAAAGRQVAGSADPSAAPTTLSLEFTRLAQLMGYSKYFSPVDRIRRFLQTTQDKSRLPGLWPDTVNFEKEDILKGETFTLGESSGPLYEYLAKMALLLAGTEAAEPYEKMYRRSMDVAIRRLLFRPMLPDKSDVLFSGTAHVGREGTRLDTESQHSACFVGGLLALGGMAFNIGEHVGLGERLTRGCARANTAFTAGVMPETVSLMRCWKPSFGECEWDNIRWDKEGNDGLPPGFKGVRDPRYLLRPEAIESLFVLYRVTEQKELRDLAWEIFESVMAATQAEFGNAVLKNITMASDIEKEDSMKSWWLGGTLKYFYLIFSPPDLVSLDEYVFNRDGHPFKRPISHRDNK